MNIFDLGASMQRLMFINNDCYRKISKNREPDVDLDNEGTIIVNTIIKEIPHSYSEEIKSMLFQLRTEHDKKEAVKKIISVL